MVGDCILLDVSLLELEGNVVTSTDVPFIHAACHYFLYWPQNVKDLFTATTVKFYTYAGSCIGFKMWS